jgi:DNA anti-recombination protein RmuC
MTAPDTATRPENGSNGGAPGNIDQIRDIIFGTQMRDYDRRFTQLEERLLKDSADMREELSRRYTALEEYIKREIDALGDRLVAEQRSRTSAVQELGGALEQLNRNSDRRMNEMTEESAKSTRELRADLSRQAAGLTEDIQRRSTELSGSLKRESDELHTRKVDRAALGAMFAEVAARLADEFRKAE